MTLRSPVLACALTLSIALGNSVASAQPAPAMVAEALFQQGRDLLKQERYAEACPKLAESQRLDPKLGTLLNLAVCNEKLGKIATAWAAYISAAAIARRDGRSEREDFAREQVALLEKRLARVTLHLKAPQADLRLRWDDQPMSGAALDTPFPVDPGKHLLTVGAPGKKEWSATVEIPADRAQIFPVAIPALEAAPEPPKPPTPPPSASTIIVPAGPPPVVEPPPTSSMRTVSYAAFGVGGAGLLIGIIAGSVTLSQAGTIRDKCSNDQCNADQQGPIDAATTTANVANVGFVFGALGVGTGVVTYLLSRSKSAESAESKPAAIQPLVGPGALGLRGTF
ncbi:MAG: tetratricopeptide repeat protein [Minicystis sp.]